MLDLTVLQALCNVRCWLQVVSLRLLPGVRVEFLA